MKKSRTKTVSKLRNKKLIRMRKILIKNYLKSSILMSKSNRTNLNTLKFKS